MALGFFFAVGQFAVKKNLTETYFFIYGEVFHGEKSGHEHAECVDLPGSGSLELLILCSCLVANNHVGRTTLNKNDSLYNLHLKYLIILPIKTILYRNFTK